MGLADRLWRETRDLHRLAERSGRMAALIAATVTRDEYAEYLCHLYPIYRALERGLTVNADRPAIAALADPRVYRARTIEGDLHALGFAPPVHALAEPVRRYAVHLRHCAETAPLALVAHAYVRFLGDLNGGVLLERRLRETLALRTDQRGYFRYPEIDDIVAFRGLYRERIDAASPSTLAGVERQVDEARQAFRWTIEIADALG